VKKIQYSSFLTGTLLKLLPPVLEHTSGHCCNYLRCNASVSRSENVSWPTTFFTQSQR